MPPSKRKQEEAKNICLLVALVLAFAAAAVSLSFTAESTLGIVCELFLDENNGTFQLQPSYPCDISVASIVIATLFLTVPLLIALIRLVFGANKYVPRRGAIILQAILLVIAMIGFIIHTVTLSLGLAKNCDTLNKGIIEGRDCKSFILDKVLFEAAVCSSLGIVLTVIAFIIFVIFHCINAKKKTDDYIPLTGRNTADQENETGISD